MSRIQDLIPGTTGPLIWLDFWDYGAQLFLDGNAIPWKDPSAFEDYYRKCLGLLEPSVAPLDIDRVIDAWLDGNTSIREAMTKRPRTSYPLKTLLADDGLRSLLARLIQTTADARASTPLALTVSSPLSLLCRIYEAAHGSPMPTITDDDCERAAVYLADLLGQYGKAGVSLVLVHDENGDSAATNYDYAYAMEPIANVADHLRWTTVLAAAQTTNSTLGFDAVFGSGPNAIGRWEADLTAMSSDTPLGKDGALLASISKEAVPESVLEKLTALRTAG